MKSKEHIAFGVKITSVELLEHQLAEPQQHELDIPVFNFDINLVHRFKAEENFIFVVCTLIVYGSDKTYKLSAVKASCSFEVDELKTFYNKKAKSYHLPDQLVITLNSITISTVRGLMFGLFRGTHLHYAVLPILNPKSFTLPTSAP